jgi:hypothetical protein
VAFEIRNEDQSSPVPGDRLRCHLLLGRRGVLVRKGGLEPPRPCGHKVLNLARLPIPPLSRPPWILGRVTEGVN